MKKIEKILIAEISLMLVYFFIEELFWFTNSVIGILPDIMLLFYVLMIFKCYGKLLYGVSGIIMGISIIVDSFIVKISNDPTGGIGLVLLVYRLLGVIMMIIFGYRIYLTLKGGNKLGQKNISIK